MFPCVGAHDANAQFLNDDGLPAGGSATAERGQTRFPEIPKRRFEVMARYVRLSFGIERNALHLVEIV